MWAITAIASASIGWGSLAITSAAALESVEPLTLLAIETSLAAAVLALLCAAWGRPFARPTRGVVLLALLEPTAAFATFNLGLRMTTSSHAGVLLGLESVFAVVLIAITTHTRPTFSTVAGICLGAMGVIVLTGLPADGGPMLTGSGDGLVLADSFIAAVYLVVASHLAPGSDPVGLTATQFLLATPMTMGAAALVVATGVERLPQSVTSHAATGIAVTSLGGVASSFLLYTWGLQRVPATTAAALVPITPLAGVAFAALVGHEPLTGNVLGSVALICLGLTVVARPGPKGAHRAERAMTGFTITSGTSADLPARNAPNNSDRADGDKAISGSPSVRLGRCTPKIPPTAPGVTQPSRWTSNPTATGDPSPPQRAR